MEQKELTPAQIIRAVPDIDRDKLHLWRRQGYIKARKAQQGRRAVYLYAEEELAKIQIMAELCQRGLRPQAAYQKARSELAAVDVLSPDESDVEEKAASETSTSENVLPSDRAPVGGRTLERFPDDFYPLMAVCGDRREDPPKTPGDLLAYSASTLDLMYFSELNLSREVRIVSDKMFAFLEDKDLRNEFGNTNLLVIGSPATNFAARRINAESLFRFNIGDESKEKLAGQQKIINRNPFDPMWLQIYLAVARGLDFDSFINALKSARHEVTDPREITLVQIRFSLRQFGQHAGGVAVERVQAVDAKAR